MLGVGSAAEETNVKLSRLALGGAVVAGAGILILGAVAEKMAGDFQQSMNRIKTGAGDVTDNLTTMGKKILQISVDTGVMSGPLTASMYLIASSGQRGAQALNTLQAAAEGAQIEMANVSDVTTILTTIQKDWGIHTFTATQYMNGLVTAVSEGKISLEDLSTAMSPILPIAAQLGISFKDVAAAMSVQTNAGLDANRAATGLQAVFVNLENPTTKASKAMKQYGVDSAAVANEMKVSLPGAFQMLIDAALKVGPVGSVAFNRAMADMVGGGTRTAKTIDALSQNMKSWTQDVADIGKVMGATSTNVQGWDTALSNLNIQEERATAAVQALFIGVGTLLLPSLTQLLAATVPLITSFTDWATSGHALNDVINAFNANTQTLVPILSGLAAVLLAALIPATVTLAGSVIAATWPFLALGVAIGGLVALLLRFHPEITTVSGAFQTMWPIIQNTGIALAVFFTPALIKAGVEAVISAAKITYSFVASLILTGAEGWAAAGKLAVFIASLITTGTTAVINAAKVTYSFIASLIATGVQAYVAAYAVSGSFTVSLEMVGTQAVIAAGKLLTGLVPALTATGVAADVALGPIGALIAIVTLAGIAFIAMKHKSDEMNLGVSGDFDSMGNKIQRSTGRIIATSDQMKEQVAAQADQMRKRVVESFSGMANQTYSETSALSANAVANFQKLNGDLQGQMSSIDAMVIGYWNDVAAYIASHQITGTVTWQSVGGPVTPGGPIGAPTTHFAGGTDSAPGGWAWVGERGPELMHVPRGAQIIPHDRSVAASGGGQPVQVNINLAGHRVAQQLLPDIVQAVRSHTGVRF